MVKSDSTVAQQVARAAIAFEQRLTGRVPKSVTVVLGADTLVITLHGALSPAELALARTPEGAAEIQEYHRRLFADSLDGLREEIRRITGVDVREAAAEVEAETGTVVKAFTTGTVVQVFLLASDVPADTWSGVGRDAGVPSPAASADGDGEPGSHRELGVSRQPRGGGAADGDGEPGSPP